MTLLVSEHSTNSTFIFLTVSYLETYSIAFINLSSVKYVHANKRPDSLYISCFDTMNLSFRVKLAKKNDKLIK